MRVHNLYIKDRLELKLVLPLEPVTAQSLRTILDTPTLKPLGKILKKLHARLEPSVGAQLAQALNLKRSYTVRFEPDKVPDNIEALRQAAERIRALRGIVDRVALVPQVGMPDDDDPLMGTPDTPITTTCGHQWYLFATKVDAAWNCGVSGEGVVVADLDWGFLPTHVDLVKAFDTTQAYDACHAVSGTADLAREHGTASAGLIAARLNKDGIRGVAYGATVWPIQAACSVDGVSRCDVDWSAAPGNPWATAIAHVTATLCNNCRKVLLIEGQTCTGSNLEGTSAVNDAIKSAVESGVVVVIAAGNAPQDASLNEDNLPFDDTGAIVVGATEYGDPPVQSPTSNFGSWVTVWAPGSANNDLTTTTDDNKCDSAQLPNAAYSNVYGGTSGASAKVAGVVALMLQKNPALTPAQVRDILKRRDSVAEPFVTGRPAGPFLDAAHAVAAAVGLEACP